MKRIIIRLILPAILILPVLSCVEFPPVIIQEERPVARDDPPPAIVTVMVPEIPPAVEPAPENPPEIVIIPEEIQQTPAPAQAPVQRVQPVFHEPPIRPRPPEAPTIESQPDLTESPEVSSQETFVIPQPDLVDSYISENPAAENLIAFSIPERPVIPPVPERPIVPPIPEYILGQGLITEEILGAFLLYNNPDIMDFALELAKIYVEEAANEGINHDIAFTQMCLETGFLRFGGLVTPEMNNFSGLGSTGPGVPGLSFPDPRTGVRAHIQHLKAYATSEPPNLPLVNPRYFLVSFGSSPRISGLAGTWAEDRLYAEKINTILERLYQFTFLRSHVALE